jgi:hypothetical protein
MPWILLAFLFSLAAPAWCLRALPPDIQSVLNQRYAGWRLIQVSPLHEESRREMVAYVEQQVKAGEVKAEELSGFDKLESDAYHPSNIVFGDFDGNGEEDCAVAIKRNKPQLLTLVVFLSQSGRYQDHVLEAIPIIPDYTLTLMKKGEPIDTEETGPAADYIRVDAPQITTHWFLFKDGRFGRVEFKG